MERLHYQPIKQFRVKRGACSVADAWSVTKVTASSPAVEVMTDLRRIPAATIHYDVSLAEANHSMILRGVRMLFVTDADRHVVGIITASDLLGEKPTRVARERLMRHEELCVGDIMVAADDLDAVSLADVLRAEVGHVIATLKHCCRQHALVVEPGPDGEPLVRGIFSASQIARQMGIPLQTAEVARTFAEIETALAA